jgi:hypothetical protein
MIMVRLSSLMIAVAIALAPAAAQAADWWWVAGEPGSQDAWFVDADSISTTGAQRSFQMLRIAADRPGRTEEGSQVDCGRASTDLVQHFVCATPEQRMSLGAMLGPMAPEVAAKAIFDASPMQTAKR